MQKLGAVILIMAISALGCVSMNSSTIVDADSHGYANGQYRDIRQGKVADWGIFAGGGGANTAAATAHGLTSTMTSLTQSDTHSKTSGGGGGAVGLRFYPPPQGDPMPFAKSIATINYSKKLQNISYDESSGQVNYQFGEPDQRARTSAFGHQPIQ